MRGTCFSDICKLVMCKYYLHPSEGLITGMEWKFFVVLVVKKVVTKYHCPYNWEFFVNWKTMLNVVHQADLYAVSVYHLRN